MSANSLRALSSRPKKNMVCKNNVLPFIAALTRVKKGKHIWGHVKIWSSTWWAELLLRTEAPTQHIHQTQANAFVRLTKHTASPRNNIVDIATDGFNPNCTHPQNIPNIIERKSLHNIKYSHNMGARCTFLAPPPMVWSPPMVWHHYEYSSIPIPTPAPLSVPY